MRNIHYLLRLNKYEDDVFLSRVKEANGVKPINFLRRLSQETIIIAHMKKNEIVLNEKLLYVLLEYKNSFRRLGNLIKAHDPSLNAEIERLVGSMQKVIDRI